VPSIAFSQVHHMKEVHWATAEAFLPRVLDGILKTGFDPGTFVNVNFPAIPPDQVRGIRVTDQGQRPPGSFIPEGRVDARTKPYYWIRIAYKPGNDHEGTDLRAMTDREVSVTPIQLDSTARAMKDRLSRAFTG
jgi:5'-nucleotidase